jgi:hypothetical protein
MNFQEKMFWKKMVMGNYIEKKNGEILLLSLPIQIYVEYD